MRNSFATIIGYCLFCCHDN